MSSIERELNAYLFYEFGFDVEAADSSVSDSWPFQLRRLTPMEEDPVFEFEDDEAYFAVVAGGLGFMPKAGMDVNDLRLQLAGGRWIAARNPVSLDVSRPGDPSLPSGLERQRALEQLGSQVVPDGSAELLEGLFLESERRYLGLFRPADGSHAVVGGLSQPISVPFPDASPWRRLAWGVGRFLEGAARDAG